MRAKIIGVRNVTLIGDTLHGKVDVKCPKCGYHLFLVEGDVATCNRCGMRLMKKKPEETEAPEHA